MQELGGSTPRQTAKMTNGNIPYHRCHAQFVNGDWPGGRRLLFFSCFHEFKPSFIWEFKFLGESCETHDLGASRLLFGD